MSEIEIICNEALGLIGYARRIGNIYDGSKGARIALDFWRQTRDELLIAMKPAWSYQDQALTPITFAPGVSADGNSAQYNTTWPAGVDAPALPWTGHFFWPNDCLWPLQIKTTPTFIPIFKPRTVNFRQGYTSVHGRVILCSEPAPILVYVAQVNDPNQWTMDFRTAVIQVLAKKFEAELASDMIKSRGQQPQEGRDARTNPSS